MGAGTGTGVSPARAELEVRAAERVGQSSVFAERIHAHDPDAAQEAAGHLGAGEHRLALAGLAQDDRVGALVREPIEDDRRAARPGPPVQVPRRFVQLRRGMEERGGQARAVEVPLADRAGPGTRQRRRPGLGDAERRHVDLDAEAAGLEPPHVENVRVVSAKRIRVEPAMVRLLTSRASIVRGSADRLFDDLPEGSVEFWEPDRRLLWAADDKRYVYSSSSTGDYVFTYAGVDDPVPEIPPGTLVRVSLATWYPSTDPAERQHCYTQVSGWFSS